MSDFREIVKFRPFFEVRKNFKLLKSRHVVYHFEVRDLEYQKYRENMNNNRFRKIHKSFLKMAKFEYFAKQIIYTYSPDHML